MPIYPENSQQVRHTDDMQDIITTVPSWILRWGITLFFFILMLIIGLSALIRYPDVVDATLKISSPNSPKPIVAKIQGKLVKLLVKQNDNVVAGQPLAYIESTADHVQVINLLAKLRELQKAIRPDNPAIIHFLDHTDEAQLGELQGSYQTFYQEYLSYKSSVENGFYVRKRAYLDKDLADLNKQEQQLNAQKTIQQRDYTLAEQDFIFIRSWFNRKQVRHQN